MLDVLRDFLPAVVILFGLIGCALLVAILMEINALREAQIALLYEQRGLREQQLSELRSMKEALESISSQQDDAADELHSLAAHFVPHLRTESDVAKEHEYSEHLAHDYDATSRYYKKLEEQRVASQAANVSGRGDS